MSYFTILTNIFTTLPCDMSKQWKTSISTFQDCHYVSHLWEMMTCFGCWYRRYQAREHPHLCCSQYVTLKTYFLLFNPTHETGTATAYTWELLIANHLDQSLMIKGRSSQIIFITRFSSMCIALLRFFTSLSRANMQEKNQFPQLNRQMLIFLHQIFICKVLY